MWDIFHSLAVSTALYLTLLSKMIVYFFIPVCLDTALVFTAMFISVFCSCRHAAEPNMLMPSIMWESATILFCPPPLYKSDALTVDLPGSQGGRLPFCIQQQEIFSAYCPGDTRNCQCKCRSDHRPVWRTSSPSVLADKQVEIMTTSPIGQR